MLTVDDIKKEINRSAKFFEKMSKVCDADASDYLKQGNYAYFKMNGEQAIQFKNFADLLEELSNWIESKEK